MNDKYSMIYTDSPLLYYNLANKSIKYWISGDTKQNYLQNLQTRYSLMEKNGWVNKTFTYSINNQGFRSGEFKDNTDIMFLGCSMTFGVGLPEENTWAYLVAEKMQTSFVNLAIPGGSLKTIFRMLYGWADKLNPTIVIILCPPEARTEVMTSQREFLQYIFHLDLQKFGEYGRHYILDEHNLELDSLLIRLAIERLCNLKKIKLIYIPFWIDHHVDLARDLSHFGINSNIKMADSVLQNYF